MPATATTGLIGQLLLARLLSAKRTGPTAARESLNRLLPAPLTDEQWQALMDELHAAGLVEEKSLRPTDAGRAAALEFLGVQELPPKTDWKAVVNRYLLPRALGEEGGRSGGAGRLRVMLLKAHFGLPAEAGNTMAGVLEAIACQQLGFPDETRLSAVKQRVLARLLGGDAPLNEKQLGPQLVRHVAGAGGGKVDELRSAVLRRWVMEQTGTSPAGPPRASAEIQAQGLLPQETGEFDLPAFARTVQAAARDCPTGRAGDKIFINHLWRHLRYEPQFMGMYFADFKRRLAEAGQQGLLRLTPADGAADMGAADVQESLTETPAGAAHMVVLGGG